MKAIVCVDKNWGIGKNGDLLVSNKLDMMHFKEITTGKVIVMGRKTLESFKNAKPLPNRTNIVLSHTEMDRDDIISFTSIEDFLSSEYNKDDTIVIGGGQIYKALLPYVDHIYVTHMQDSYDADTFFPNLDEMDEFEISFKSHLIVYNNVTFRYVEYKRK